MDILALELRKLGLSEKEAKVYLAGLELGPCSVQSISQKTNLTRPTTYGIIKKLEEKGLFVEGKQRNKRLFAAQSPENVLGILRTQKRELEEKEREFIRIIATLEAKYSQKESGEIKKYKGKEGLKALEEILSFSSVPEILVVNSQGAKKLKPVFQKIKKRLGRIKVKEVKAKVEGTLIVFDKIIFFPGQKKEGFLIDFSSKKSRIKNRSSKKRVKKWKIQKRRKNLLIWELF